MTPILIRTRVVHVLNRVVFTPIPWTTTLNLVVQRALARVMSGQVLEAKVTGAREEETEHLRLHIVAIATILVFLKDHAEAQIRKKGLGIIAAKVIINLKKNLVDLNLILPLCKIF